MRINYHSQRAISYHLSLSLNGMTEEQITDTLLMPELSLSAIPIYPYIKIPYPHMLLTTGYWSIVSWPMAPITCFSLSFTDH